jgi:hypothetical protein
VLGEGIDLFGKDYLTSYVLDAVMFVVRWYLTEMFNGNVSRRLVSRVIRHNAQQ